jgi:Na+-transporting NADH:ubiquinone oxidoreductase subunit B
MKQIVLKQPVMFKVLYSLVPVALFSIFLFGWRILLLLAVCNIFAFLAEYVFIRNKKGGKVTSATFVTGSLLALILPPLLPLWMAAIGSIVAIVFGKMLFGGFGMNIFNPAILGRTFLYITFANEMTANWVSPFTSFPGGFANYTVPDLISSATPIASENGFDLCRLFFGLIPGSIGETSAFLILMAGIYLVVTKTAKWQTIITTLASFLLFSFIFNPAGNLLAYLFSGGILFGTVFMATDPISSPKNKYALLIYSVLLGFLTVFIREFSIWAGGFMFALLLVNSFMPIIEYLITKPKPQSAKNKGK